MQIFLFNISSTLWSENYLETNLTGKCYSEDIISFAEVIIPRIVLVYGVLSSDGDTIATFSQLSPAVKRTGNNLEKQMTIMMNLSKTGAQTNQWINLRTLQQKYLSLMTWQIFNKMKHSYYLK